MASIEITSSLVVSAGGWLVSTIIATWALSRRSKSWDDAENHEEVLYGNRRTGDPGALQRIKTLEGTVGALAERFKDLITALEAHGSGAHQISEGVRRKIREHAHEAYQEILDARRKVLTEQAPRFNPRPDESFVTLEEEDPFKPHRRLLEEPSGDRRKK